jgi:hypothetical protein
VNAIEGIPRWNIRVYPTKAVGNSWARIPERFRLVSKDSKGDRVVFVVTSSAWDVYDSFVVLRLEDFGPMFTEMVLSEINDLREKK